MNILFHSLYPELLGEQPKHIREIKGTVEIFTDDSILTANNPNGIAMLVEPRSIIPHVYEYIEENYSKFRNVFTFDSVLLEKVNNAKLLLFGTAYAYFDEPKIKAISMVCSDKGSCAGHKQRKELAMSLKGTIDTYGKFDGGKYADIRDVLAPYKFNVAVENYKDGFYFTEKICNCFASRTIPIYYGSDNITEFFNPDGIIMAEISDIPSIIEHLDVDYEYEKRLPAIEDNLNRVKKYSSFGGTFFRMYSNYLKEVAEV